MKKTTPEVPATDAATLVASCESLPLGATVAAAMMAAAAQKIAEQRDAADEALFAAASINADASAFLALQRIESSAPGGLEYGSFMASWHARALRAHVPLAGLIRALCVADVGAHAARLADVLVRPANEVAAEAVAAFKCKIARQLADHADLGAAARSFVAAAEDLAQRLATIKARHEAHAATERQRVEEERQAAERRELDEQIAASLRADAEAVAARSRLASAEERARLTAALALKSRLLKTRCKRLVIGRQVYDPASVAATILECSDVQVRAFGGALDYAEQAQAS
jgi:hypothetical protein